ncbi:ABC transporter related [Ignisphaera aggregans DSM 17230]|uniref:ABC transporter related n=1 Tax=Ignisphaera aggregans (strain DSM 17230 / JCM 13409 / AQ1.S1) TaxID=583356 RepID=E0SQH9_IGNAA|nr:ABC transporter related [Ignisphaera aggregans DSM 17230]
MKIELIDVYYRYPGQQEYALKNINIVFEAGKIYLVTGPNGAGKTTLLLVTAGLLKPEKGDVILNGVSLFKQLPGARRLFGFLFQNPDLMLFNPTVYDEITYSIRQICNDEERIKSRVKELLKFFEIDENILSRPIHTLSYGYKKIVALMSILIYNPKILLLDEPHTNLSRKFVEKLKKVIVLNRESGGITIIASHNRNIYRGLADYIIHISNGEIVKIYNIYS